MIASRHRFHGHNSLRQVYQHGQTVRGPLTSLKYTRDERRKNYRLAVVVSKKVHKSAVIRNRIRRRIYEAVRREQDQIIGSYSLVITVFHDNVAELSPDEVTKMVKAQLKQAGIMTQKPESTTEA